jgi:hypothetical protein
MRCALIGSGGVHFRDVSIHQYSGFLVPKGCSG